MKNILPKIAFTVCAAIGTNLINNETVANIDRSYDPIERLTSNMQRRLQDVKLSKQFARAVIRDNPVQMQYSNDEMSQICSTVSQTIRDSGYKSSCVKDTNEIDANHTLDIFIAGERLEKFALDTNDENRDEASGRFKRAVYLGVIGAYSHIHKKISQMYLDGSKEDKANYNAYIRLNTPQ